MRKYLVLSIIMATVGGAMAQNPPNGGQAPDPAFMQKALAAIQQQRNAEADQRAVAEARAAMLQDDVTKLQKELAEARKPKEDAK